MDLFFCQILFFLRWLFTKPKYTACLTLTNDIYGNLWWLLWCVCVYTCDLYFFFFKKWKKLWNIRVVIAKYLSQNCEYVSFNVFISHDCTFFSALLLFSSLKPQWLNALSTKQQEIAIFFSCVWVWNFQITPISMCLEYHHTII